jgi:uncharacterized protein YndB with AHSA1/START domain
MTEPDTFREFETRIDLAAPKDAVWKALTDAEELRRWFAPVASVEAEVGGEIVWEWNAHHRWPQRVEILEPGVRLKTRYDSAVDDGKGGKKPLYIDFILEGTGGTTSLRVVQSGFGSEAGFDSEYDGISRGWPVELRSLRLYLEQHAGADRVVAWSTRNLDLDAAEAWQRLAGDQGFACGAEVQSMNEGDPFQFETADGDVFSGWALQCGAREFSGNASSHGDAFLRVSVEEYAGSAFVWCWLGAYDQSPDDLASLQVRWDAMLERLFAVAGETA